MLKIVTAAVTALALTTGAALAESAVLTVGVTVSRALIVTAGSNINFGSLVATSDAGGVTMNVGGSNCSFAVTSVVPAGGVTGVDYGTATPGTATFYAPRPGNYGIAFLGGPFRLTHESQPTNPKITYQPALQVFNYNVNTYGHVVCFWIGGNLQLPLDTAEGSYLGTITVNVNNS